MGRKTNTEYKVVTFYDGEVDAVDIFTDIIRSRLREKRYGKSSENAEKDRDLAYNSGEVQDYPDPAPRLCG